MGKFENLVTSAREAVSRIPSGATVAVGGSGSGHAIPDILLRALGERLRAAIGGAIERLGERFRETGEPRGLTLVHPFGVGNQQDRGLEHVAQEGLWRRVIGGHWSMAPSMGRLAADEAFEAYCLPAGVIVQMFHAAAAGSPGWMTHVGLDTFVDPRHEGGKLNASATEDLVELVVRDGREWLFYPTIPIDVALIHAWQTDPAGNLAMNQEAGFWHNCRMAQAAKAAGGIVIAAVRETVDAGTILPRDVRIPACLVDVAVLDAEQGQTFQTDYDPSFTGEARKPDADFPPAPFDVRKVIARRAAMELEPGAIVNVGFGVPDGVMSVAREQGFAEQVTTTIEHGQFGGTPAGGLDFGAVHNPEAILETGKMFDLYHGDMVEGGRGEILIRT